MAGRSSRRQGGGNERIQALVEEKLQQNLQYEALQLYRGVVSRKSARADHDGAIAIAEQGMGVLLRAGYADSATELGNVLVGILSERELSANEERVGVIKRLNTAYEDAKRAEVLAEEDKRASEAALEGDGSVGNGAVVEGNGPRGIYSIGILQVNLLYLCKTRHNRGSKVNLVTDRIPILVLSWCAAHVHYTSACKFS